ncbi:MAG: RNA polymerase factor sigma-54 [Candidatus Omnitrophota bacterium]
MKISQRTEQRRLLIPQLRKSLKILTLPLLDLKISLEEELINNPLLEVEELHHKDEISNADILSLPSFGPERYKGSNLDFRASLITKKVSLQDILLRQLGMFANTDEELKVGQEIIGNIDENGYLEATLDEIASSLNLPVKKVENALKLIQRFEPPGVGARTVSECLLIQLDSIGEKDPLIRKILESHIEDLAKKNYKAISKALKEPIDKIEPLIKKILKLDPKPGRLYSSEEIHHIIPDILIEQKDEDFKVIINNENIPRLRISKTYREMLKRPDLDPQTKEFLTEKLRNALELIRSISKRKNTLRRVIELVVDFQQDAVRQGLSHLKPFTFAEVAQRLKIHESTVSRTVMSKYVQLSWGVVALKDFFSSHIHDTNGQPISSSHTKRLIKELIEHEDKKRPLSDQDISEKLAKERQLNISRRTVAKYREQLKILSTAYRRER